MYKLKLSFQLQKNKILLCIGILLVSCGQQSINSDSGDKERSQQGAPTVVVADTPFAKAFNVLQTKCNSCHSGYHSSWSKLTTSEQWLASGLVLAKRSSDSDIIKRLKNFGGNMPQSAAPLTTAEVKILTDWIDGL